MLDDVTEVVDATMDEVNVAFDPEAVEIILVDSNMVDSDLGDDLYRDLVGMHWVWLIVISVNSKRGNAQRFSKLVDHKEVDRKQLMQKIK